MMNLLRIFQWEEKSLHKVDRGRLRGVSFIFSTTFHRSMQVGLYVCPATPENAQRIGAEALKIQSPQECYETR
jgi:hypothetical protein